MKRVEFPIRNVDGDVFRALKDGSKRVEVRAGGPKYNDIAEGDVAVFIYGDESVERLVEKIRRFGSLDELLGEYSVRLLTPWVDSKEDYIRRMNGFPGYPERIAEFGLIVLELEK